jgi:hypothetical protein
MARSGSHDHDACPTAVDSSKVPGAGAVLKPDIGILRLQFEGCSREWVSRVACLTHK